jgi:hypothetical protein
MMPAAMSLNLAEDLPSVEPLGETEVLAREQREML